MHGLDPFLEHALDLFEQRFVLLVHRILGHLAVTLGQVKTLTRHVRERLAFVVAQSVDEPRIDSIRQQQHLDASLCQAFKMRARGCRRMGFGDEVVDLVLLLASPADVFIQGLVLIVVA